MPQLFRVVGQSYRAGRCVQAVHLYLRSFQTASSSQQKEISETRYRHLSNACLPLLQCCNLLDEPRLALQASHVPVTGLHAKPPVEHYCTEAAHAVIACHGRL